MTIGNYKIGRYHAIIKKIYSDGSVDYETSFSDESDFNSSVLAMNECLGKRIGLATNNPRILAAVIPLRGKENILTELK